MQKFAKNEHLSIKKSIQTRVDWLDQFADNLASGQAYKDLYNTNPSLIEQIYGLIGQKRTYSSVEDKIKDMQERTGLTAYWKRQAQVQDQNQNNAYPFNHLKQEVQDKINIFIKNRIETYHGHVPILSLQEDLIETFKHDGLELQDVYREITVAWLQKMIDEEKKKHPNEKQNISHLGKSTPNQEENDLANTDFFASMMPKDQ